MVCTAVETEWVSAVNGVSVAAVGVRLEGLRVYGQECLCCVCDPASIADLLQIKQSKQGFLTQ